MQTFPIKKSPTVLLLGLLFVWSMVVTLCCIFVANIYKVTTQEVDRYLLEISNGISSSVNSRMESMFTILGSTGTSYFQYVDNDEFLAREYLRDKSFAYGFRRLAFTDSSGRTVSSDGKTVNLAAFPNVMRAFKGEKLFRRLRSSPVDGTDGILYVSPVYYSDTIVGVITAWCDVGHIQQYLNAHIFGGKGHFHILDEDGNVLLGPPEEDAIVLPNYLSLLTSRAEMKRGSAEGMRERMHKGQSGRLDFTLDETREITAAYVPLQSVGLYLIAIAPSDVALAQFGDLLARTLKLVFIIVAMFTGLAVLLFFKDRKSTHELAHVAFVDPVTGGMTRTRFQLEALPKIAAAPPGAYSLVSANIKLFKMVNDILGNEIGDKLLKQCHDCMKEHMTEDELICRDYADDFVLLVTTKKKEQVLQIIESVSTEVNRFLEETGCKYTLRLYVGLYEVDDSSLSLVGMLDRANIARKNSKAAIRGHLYDCVFYSDLERLRMIKTKDIENKMEQALADEEFLVYLQPKIELENKTVVGAEALVRWQDKERGLIPPGDFIPCFEANGFIIKLDLYVFEHICRLLRKWIDMGLTPVPVSVNLSRAHLIDPDFLEYYVAISNRYAIPHSLLEIELTESLLLENFECLKNVVDQLHDLGFRCSLDDFGCGYSSLNMLKDLNVDTLKLDGAFWFSPNADNQREKDIIAAVVGLAKKLGMSTVSEGVETVTQLEFLRQIRCDMVQGFVFSKPVPPETFEEIAFGLQIAGEGG